MANDKALVNTSEHPFEVIPDADTLLVGTGVQSSSGNLNLGVPGKTVLARINSATGAFEVSGDAGVTWGLPFNTTQHEQLRQLIHFIDDGPAEGFATGSYNEITPAGSPFPTSCIWYTSSAKTSKIVEENATWNSDGTVATDVWKMYATDGSTVIATVTDTYSYTGGNFLTPKRTRTIA